MSELSALNMWPDVSDFLPDHVLEVIRTNAVEADSAARVPDANVACLQQSKYFGAAVPKHLGGGGASLVKCAAIHRAIARIDAGLAVGLTMHLNSIADLNYRLEAGTEHLSGILRDIAANQLVLCSAAAEPNLGGAIAKSALASTPCEGGYLISGKKSPVSLARLGSYMGLQFPNPAMSNGEVLTAVLPMRREGISIERTWDTLGVRSSESNTIVLRECFVSTDDCLELSGVESSREQQLYGAGNVIAWYCVPLTAVYLGIVDCVLAETKAQLKSQTLYSKRATRSSLSSFQCAFGEILPKVLMLECACVSLAEKASQKNCNFAQMLSLVFSLKYVAVDVCTEAVSRAAELIGARSYGQSGVVARALRDVHALPLHSPNRIMSRGLIGRLMLDVDIDYDYPD